MGPLIRIMSNLLKKRVRTTGSSPAVNRAFGQDENWGLVAINFVRHDGRAAARGWHRQGNYALNFIQRGCGHLESPGHSRTLLGPGLAYQHFPDATNAAQLCWELGEEIQEWFVILDRRLYQRLAALGIFPSQRVLDLSRSDPTAFFLSFYERMALLENTPPSQRLPLVLAESVYFLGRFFAAAASPEPAGHWPHIVRAAREQMDLDAASREPLPELARRLGVSYASLRRAFQSETGQSLNAYRIARRIDDAKARLLRSDVAAVADQLGYPDPFTFSAQFKKLTGQSPRAFRLGGHPPCDSV
jgi:AraC-like DNA-binding protein